MKRYKLLKDLPTFKAGDLFEINPAGNLWHLIWNEYDEDYMYDVIAYCKTTLDRFPNILTDWFEEIPEQSKTVWDLKDGDECYQIMILSNGPTVVHTRWGRGLEHVRDMGLIGVTQEEAEKELARRKAKQILLRDTKGFKPDWTSYDEDRYYVCFSLFCGSRTKNHLGHLSVANAKWAVLDAILFATQADAEASIKAHEKEWKTYLGVEE